MEVKSDCKCMPSDIQAGDETARVVLPSEAWKSSIVQSMVQSRVHRKCHYLKCLTLVNLCI